MNKTSIIICACLLLLDCCYLGYLLLFRHNGQAVDCRCCVIIFQHIYTLTLLFYHAYTQYQEEPEPEPSAWLVAFMVGNFLIFGLS